MLFFSVGLFGQIQNSNDIPKEFLEQLEKMGVDNSPLLNGYESEYLNVVFKDSLNGFDFLRKKIGFICSGENSKFLYFDMQKKHILDKNNICNNGHLYVFNTSQKEESGGYDGAIVYWSKRIVPIEKIIRWLKSKH